MLRIKVKANVIITIVDDSTVSHKFTKKVILDIENQLNLLPLFELSRSVDPVSPLKADVKIHMIEEIN